MTKLQKRFNGIQILKPNGHLKIMKYLNRKGIECLPQTCKLLCNGMAKTFDISNLDYFIHQNSKFEIYNIGL